MEPVTGVEQRAVWSLAFLEGFFSTWEYILGLTCFGIMTKEMLKTVPGGNIIATVIATFAIMMWMVWRFSNTSEIRVKQLVRRMGLFRPRVSSHVAIVFVVYLVSFCFTVWFQQRGGKVLFSTSNFYDESTGELLFEKVGDMLFLAPLREEFFFRGVMFSMIYRRMGSIEKDTWRTAVLNSGLAFGCLHAMNFFSEDGPSKLYIALQVFTGLVIGWFYTLRFIATGNIWECIALHVVHNLFASLVPKNLGNPSLYDLTFVVPALSTIIIHAILARIALKAVEKKGGFNYTVIDISTEAATRLPAFTKSGDNHKKEMKAVEQKSGKIVEGELRRRKKNK